MDSIEKYFEKALKVRQIIEGTALENNMLTDIYTATDKLDNFLQECISNIKPDSSIGLSFYHDGVRYIKLIKGKELQRLPTYIKQRDKKSTFDSVKKNLLYHIQIVIDDLDKRMQGRDTGQ